MTPPKGTLYLIPLPLHEHGVGTIPQDTLKVLDQLDVLIAERARTARRWIRQLLPQKDISVMTIHELDKHKPNHVDPEWLAAAKEGISIGLVSEAGCPGVADPGANVVRQALKMGIPIQALVGPSAILLALMGSGMNGQSFAFHGYLAPRMPERQGDLQRLERMVKQEAQTQIFIETPYRNQAIFEAALQHLQPETLFGVAVDLTGSQAFHRTMPISEWRKSSLPVLDKLPAVFLIGSR